jgi:hypothetical protein
MYFWFTYFFCNLLLYVLQFNLRTSFNVLKFNIRTLFEYSNSIYVHKFSRVRILNYRVRSAKYKDHIGKHGDFGDWFVNFQLFGIFFSYMNLIWSLLLETLNNNHGRVFTPAFPKILVRKLTLRHADEWQSTCSTSREKKLMTSTSLYSKIHLI